MASQNLPSFNKLVSLAAVMVLLFALNISTTWAQSSSKTLSDINMVTRDLKAFIEDMKRENKKLVLFLDFDGTLSKIVSQPEDAVIVRESKDALKKLAKKSNVYVGIISGRELNDLQKKVGIENIAYAGNHGFEIIYRDSKKKPFVYPLNEEIKTKHKKLVEALQKNLEKGGARVEDKTLTVTFHYRNAKKSEHDSLIKKAKSIIEHFGFRAKDAHCAVEAIPNIVCDKGTTVKKLLNEEFTSKWDENVKVIYAGDDTVDEPAMKVLKGKGLTFRVSNSSTVETYADHRVEDPKVIAQILTFLAENL